MPVVLVPLAALLIALWVIAFCLLIAVIMGYVSGALSGLPFPLDKIAGPVKSLASGMANVAAKLEAGVDHLIGGAWHWMARYLDRTWHQMEAQAHLAWVESVRLADLAYSHLGIKAAVHSIADTARSAWHLAKRLEAWSLRMERRIHKLEHDLGHGIGNDVLPRIKTLEREVNHLDNRVIPRVESAEQALARDVSALGEYIRSNFVSTATDAITAAVAVALGAMGLSGLRCSSLLRSLGNRGCGLWSGIEDLLGLFVDTLLLTNICDLLPVLETAVSDVADPLVIALTDVGAGLCDGGIGAAPALAVPSLHLPASPGLTLNLP